MKDRINYECATCGKKRTLAADEPKPECCKKSMNLSEPLPVCETASGAEHSRLDDDSGPCDDGRAGGSA